MGAGHPPIRRNRRQSIEAGAEAKAKAEEPVVESTVKAVLNKAAGGVEEPIVEPSVEALEAGEIFHQKPQLVDRPQRL